MQVVAPGPVGPALDEPVLDQCRQPSAEHGARDVQPRLQLAEAPHAEEEVAQDQQRPALADDLERPRQRAALRLVLARKGHGRDGITFGSLIEPTVIGSAAS
jgi:hypothetical protein